MKIAYRAFITILIAFAFAMTIIGFVKHIPLVFFLSLACIFVAIAYYIYKSAYYKLHYEWESCETTRLRDLVWKLKTRLNRLPMEYSSVLNKKEDK